MNDSKYGPMNSINTQIKLLTHPSPEISTDIHRFLLLNGQPFGQRMQLNGQIDRASPRHRRKERVSAVRAIRVSSLLPCRGQDALFPFPYFFLILAESPSAPPLVLSVPWNRRFPCACAVRFRSGERLARVYFVVESRRWQFGRPEDRNSLEFGQQLRDYQQHRLHRGRSRRLCDL